MNSNEVQKRLLNLREIVATTGLSKATVYRAIERGTFPRQVQLSAHRVGWQSEKIEAWLNGLPDAR